MQLNHPLQPQVPWPPTIVHAYILDSEGGSAGPLPLVTASGYGRTTTGDCLAGDWRGLPKTHWETIYAQFGPPATSSVAINDHLIEVIMSKMEVLFNEKMHLT